MKKVFEIAKFCLICYVIHFVVYNVKCNVELGETPKNKMKKNIDVVERERERERN